MQEIATSSRFAALLVLAVAALHPAPGIAASAPPIKFKQHALGETLQQAKRAGLRSCRPAPYLLLGISDKKIEARAEVMMAKLRSRSGDMICFSPNSETMAGYPAEAVYTFYRNRLERIEVVMRFGMGARGDIGQRARHNEETAQLVVDALEERFGPYVSTYRETGKRGMRSQPRERIATWALGGGQIVARHPESWPYGGQIEYTGNAYRAQDTRARADAEQALAPLVAEQQATAERLRDRRKSDI